jgi:rubrerythrin
MIACSGGGADGPGDGDGGAIDATLAPGDGSAAVRDAGASARDASTADATVPDALAQGGCPLGARDLGSAVGVDGAIDGQDTCAVSYGCGLPEGLGNAGCNVWLAEADGALLPGTVFGSQCWIPEDSGCTDDVYVPAEGGAITVFCYPCFGGGGRRPAGLVRERSVLGAGLGAYLAALAYEENASITAFERMRVELWNAGAPRVLSAAAGRAARDEVRHARTMTRLAEKRGGRVVTARVRRARGRSELAMALQNAVEGCVRETYGALLAQWQAAHAGDLELRRAFSAIARDEARHASLSWALARWIEPRLDENARARVDRARARAVRHLANAMRDPEARLAADAGLPSAAESRALLTSLASALGITTDARRSLPRRAAPSP